MLIDTLDLSKKAIKVLNNRKVYTVADLLKFDRIRLKFICGLGKEDVNQILRVIDNLLEIEETVNKDDDVEHENGKKDDIIDFFNQFKK